MEKRAVGIAIVCFCFGLAGYQAWAGFRWFERNAELIEMAKRYRAPRRVRPPDPMTLEMVRRTLIEGRGGTRMRAVLDSRRFIAEHPDLTGLLLRVCLGRKTDSRVAAAAAMVLRGVDGPLAPEGVDELVKVIRDRDKCCPEPETPDQTREEKPEKKLLKEVHVIRCEALEMLCAMNSGVVGVVPKLIAAERWDCLNRERRRRLEWIGPGQRGDLEALSKLVDSTEAHFRYDAAICLGYHSYASDSVAPLLAGRLTSETSSGMRKVMLASYVRVAGQRPIVAEKVAQALKDPNCIVRAEAAGLLGRFTTDRRKHAELLVAALDDFWHPVRRRAAESLGRLGVSSPSIAKRLLAAMDDENRVVRFSAAEALAKLDRKKWARATTEFFITQLRGDSFEACSAAARAIGRIGPEAEPACGALIELLENGDIRLARPAAEALRRIGPADQAQINRIVKVLTGADRDQSRGIAAAGAILSSGREGPDVELALDFLRSRSELRPALDCLAIELLARRRPMSSAAADVLLRFAADYCSKSWSSSVSGADRAVILAAEGMGASDNPAIRRAGIAILVWVMKTGRRDFSANVISAPGAVLDRSDPKLRRAMMRANLGRYEQRLSAIEALGRLGPTASIAADRIAEMANWKDVRLIAPAQAALKRIAGGGLRTARRRSPKTESRSHRKDGGSQRGSQPVGSGVLHQRRSSSNGAARPSAPGTASRQ